MLIKFAWSFVFSPKERGEKIITVLFWHSDPSINNLNVILYFIIVKF